MTTYANPRSPGLGFAAVAASTEPTGNLSADQVELLRLASTDPAAYSAAGGTGTASGPGLSQYLTTNNLLWAAGLIALAVILKER